MKWNEQKKKHRLDWMKKKWNTLHHVQSIEFVQYFAHFMSRRHDFNSYALICYLFYKYNQIESKWKKENFDFDQPN